MLPDLYYKDMLNIQHPLAHKELQELVPGEEVKCVRTTKKGDIVVTRYMRQLLAPVDRKSRQEFWKDMREDRDQHKAHLKRMDEEREKYFRENPHMVPPKRSRLMKMKRLERYLLQQEARRG